MESLEQACAYWAATWWRLIFGGTLDGELVLNHDGVLERLTDGVGDAEQSLLRRPGTA